MIKLSWENSDPNRWYWSAMLYYQIADRWNILKNATDITKFRPDWDHLSVGQQQAVFAEIMVSDALYESSWVPTSNSQDVGTADKSTWSVGLWQMSACDCQNYGLPFSYTFAELQNVSANTVLAIAIMAKQIEKYGKILIAKGEPGLYWATLHPGGEYDKSPEIIARVQGMELA